MSGKYITVKTFNFTKQVDEPDHFKWPISIANKCDATMAQPKMHFLGIYIERE